MSLSPRASSILSRFPRHLALDAPGSLFGAVVDGLAGHLDRLTADLGRVRSAHRFGQVSEQADLLLLAALHGLRADLLEPCRRRIAGAATLAQGLAGDAAAQAAALAALPDLLAQAAEAWPAAAGETADQVLARMAAAIALLARNAGAIERQRGVVAGLIAVHRAGNASPGALLHAAAALLALQPLRQRRSHDDYWHVLDCADQLRADSSPTPRTDLLALEENPEQAVDIGPTPRRHRELFTVQRLGFGPVPADVIVTALEDRCTWPMVVDVGAGRALVYAAALGAGQTLRFRASGIVELDGAEAGNRAFAIDGGVFADAAAAVAEIDFVFADAADEAAFGDRAARFGVCRPVASALDGPLPHSGGLTPPISLRVGSTRLRFFVREAAFGSEAGGADVAAVPLFAAGLFDASLAADTAADTSANTGANTAALPAAELGFAWRERQAYTCTLWLPRRFSLLDGAGQVEIRERVRLALDRVRPAGVYLGVAYADDRWTLGDGVLRDADSAEPEGLIIHGTRLSMPLPVLA
jgi:hypothetical protein